MRRIYSAFCIFLGAVCAPAQTLTDPSLVVESVIQSGGTAASPTAMAFIAPGDILVAEKGTGLVRRVTNGTLAAAAVLDLPVANNSERGLLGLALHPSFGTNGFVYLYYTSAANDGGTLVDYRVERYTWNGSVLTAPTPILTVPPVIGDGPNHDGGPLAFGPPTAPPASQKLFLLIGDLNRNNQTENYAAGAVPDHSGCILRLNDDGSIPADNPFFNVAGANDALKRTYAYGIRNSFGMDFDPVTGVLWQTENGPNNYDEINSVAPAFNSGWEYIMGPTARNSLKGAPGLIQFGGIGTYSDPEFSWLTPVAPTAVHFLRGGGLNSAYINDCFAGDVNTGRLYHFEMNGPRDGFVLTGGLADLVVDNADSTTAIVLGNGFGGITDLETGPDGNLYVLSIGLGQVFRIRAATGVSEWAMY